MGEEERADGEAASRVIEEVDVAGETAGFGFDGVDADGKGCGAECSVTVDVGSALEPGLDDPATNGLHTGIKKYRPASRPGGIQD